MSEPLLDFLELVSETLLQNAAHPLARDGADRVAAALGEGGELQNYEASSIGALSTLAALEPHPLTTAALAVAPTLPWIPSPRVDDDGTNVGLVLLDQCVELAGIQAGLTVVGPHGEYPEHSHPPAEVYLVLGGKADWRFGGSTDFKTLGPGGVVHNNPKDRHVIRTNDEPTIAIWFLWDT